MAHPGNYTLAKHSISKIINLFGYRISARQVSLTPSTISMMPLHWVFNPHTHSLGFHQVLPSRQPINLMYYYGSINGLNSESTFALSIGSSNAAVAAKCGITSSPRWSKQKWKRTIQIGRGHLNILPRLILFLS